MGAERISIFRVADWQARGRSLKSHGISKDPQHWENLQRYVFGSFISHTKVGWDVSSCNEDRRFDILLQYVTVHRCGQYKSTPTQLKLQSGGRFGVCFL